MGRQPCCDKFGLKRGPWTIEEDHKLMSFILNNGIQCWRMVPKLAGLLRCGKSCRLRWINYLRPDLKRGAFSETEEDQIIELHARLGNRWSKIASHFPGRTDNEIKNHWNTRIKKRMKLQGLDPVTHQPIEPNDHVEEKNVSDIEPNVQNKQELAIPMQQGNDEIITAGSSQARDECQTSYMMNEYRNLDMDLWTMSQLHLTNPNSSGYSPSFEETTSVSYANSAGKSTVSVHEESSMVQNWVDSVDSMMPWDCFNQLDQQFYSSFHSFQHLGQ